MSVDKGPRRIFLMACAVLVLILSCSIINNVKASPEVIWNQTSNPSKGDDWAIGVAVDSSGMYAVGSDNSPNPGSDNFEWRIEKRNLTDGTIIWNQTSNPSKGDDWATGVAVDSSGIYVVGYDNSPGNDEWRIEKRNLTDGTIIWNQTSNPSPDMDRAIGVAVDDSGTYMVGFDRSPGNDEWRIEKRNLTDGTIIWNQTSNPSNTGDEAIGVATDSTGVYVVGYDTSQGPEEWRMEKRSVTDGAVVWTQISNPSLGVDETWGVAVDSSGMYAVGSDNSPNPGSDNFEWRIEKRNLTDGTIIWNQTSNPSKGDDWAIGVAVDSSGMYVVGYDNAPGNVEWRIEKISEKAALPFYMQTWFIASTVIVIVAVVLAVVFIMRRKVKLVTSTPSLLLHPTTR
jgi:hypothetical protein